MNEQYRNFMDQHNETTYSKTPIMFVGKKKYRIMQVFIFCFIATSLLIGASLFVYASTPTDDQGQKVFVIKIEHSLSNETIQQLIAEIPQISDLIKKQIEGDK